MSGAMKGIWVALALVAVAGAARAENLCGSWQPIPFPDAPAARLVSVSASSPTDAWTVGTALHRWNGSVWSPVQAPGKIAPDPLGYADTVFWDVFARTPTDAWIAGYTAFLGSPQTLLERWDGSSWSVVPSPVNPGGSVLDGVFALSANDAWAVGSCAGSRPETEATAATLTVHWDGANWTRVPSPNVADRHHELLDVVALSPNDVWAVGASRNWTEDFQTLILHWNGSQWSVTPSPNLPGENLLFGVSATAANDVWAVGEAWDGATLRQVFLHWNGSAWSQVTGPGGATVCAECGGDVLAMGPNDVWAVGSAIGHWDGTQWTVLPDPELPGTLGIGLRSLARAGACDVWSAGSRFDTDGIEHPLTLRLGAGQAEPPVSVDPRGTAALALRVRPNPSRGESSIALTLPQAQHVRIEVMDASGRLVREVASAWLPAGDHAYAWNGSDASGRRASAGVYWVTVTSGSERVSTRTLRLP